MDNSGETLNTPKPDKKSKEKPHFRFGDVDNANVDKADVEKRHDNKILSNQILSNQSVSQSAAEKAPAEKNENDGLTDGQKKSMPFSQVIKEIGFDTYGIDFEPTSEKELQEFDEEDRKTSSCTIPYSLKADKKAMKEILKFLFAYSYYAPSLPDKDKRLLDTVITVLTEMTGKDIQEYQGQRVRYCDVIDRLNDVIHSPDGSLYDWYISFEQQWNKILAENNIKHQKTKAYKGLLIHDYFFAKSLDSVRSGGVVAFVTSTGTLDKEDIKVRQMLAQKAELMGAVRLPNNAFQKNAGTQTPTDIIFLKKREKPLNIGDMPMDKSCDWVHTKENADGLKINSYFADNPEMVLGELSDKGRLTNVFLTLVSPMNRRQS